MIYYYKHKSINEFSESEIDMMGYEGVYQYATEHGIDPNELFFEIKQLENDIKYMQETQFDMSQGENLELMNKWVNLYIDYFNKYATCDKQAYILLGNIATGKSTYARKTEEETQSIIVDPDRFKMGEITEKGMFEGFTSLYKEPTDRERLQEPCSEACKKTLKNVAERGMNLIMPKATTSLEKLEKQLQVLLDNGYDIHLILIECPLSECADRNYYRYLIKEYQDLSKIQNGDHPNGRFVPVSVITNIGDGSYNTFVNAKNGKKYKSYKAIYNDKLKTEEIDINTMLNTNLAEAKDIPNEQKYNPQLSVIDPKTKLNTELPIAEQFTTIPIFKAQHVTIDDTSAVIISDLNNDSQIMNPEPIKLNTSTKIIDKDNDVEEHQKQ